VTRLPTPHEILTLGERACRLLDDLAEITDRPGRITRTYLSPAHDRALDRVGGWMVERRLKTSRDAVATLRGRRPADPNRPSERTLFVGSHIDSVIDGGRFDGCLGVVAGLLAVEELDRRGIALPFAVEVLAFGDEEGVRFPTQLSSSAAAAGCYRREWLAAEDDDGVTLSAALRGFGADPEAIESARIDPRAAVGWIEVHIEQGPRLERLGLPLGVVGSIAGQSRFGLTVTGTAGHAGTLPMDLRRDAFAGLAEIAVAVERIARAGDAALVATIGRVEVSPGAGNIVPGRAEATLDVRAEADEPRFAAIEAIVAEATAIAERRGLTLRIEPQGDGATRPMDPDLRETLARAVGSLGLACPRLPSGAGHDAMVMATVMPAAMLFVRSKGGISHNPLEWSAPEDIGLAIEALIRAIVDLGEQERDRR
jgi:allantoate deiminase